MATKQVILTAAERYTPQTLIIERAGESWIAVDEGRNEQYGEPQARRLALETVLLQHGFRPVDDRRVWVPLVRSQGMWA